MTSPDNSYDVIVIGSGSAACSAALRAAHGGLRVVVLEKTAKLGGTSAMSGAGIWMPANHVAAREGHSDSRDEARAYIRAAAPLGWAETEAGLWDAFVEHGPDALHFIEENTPLCLRVVAEPDPMTELPGGKPCGRMVSPLPLPRRLLGANARHLRGSTLPHSFTYHEIIDTDLYHHPVRAGLRLWPNLLWRKLTGAGGQGTALMVALIRGCMDAGVTFCRNMPAQRLLQDDSGAVTGVEALHATRAMRITARCGVVLASGGFEWDDEMRRTHFPGPTDRIGSPRSNTGDGQKMAAAIGAKLDRMDQANIYPCLPTRYEGRLHAMPMTFQTEPHSIIVNRHARRFVSESDFNIGEHLDKRDPETGQPVHLPCFLVGDHRFLKSSMPFRWYHRYDRGWVKKARTLEELAALLGLPAEALTSTVARFNAMCAQGADADFGRGQSGWEAYKAHAEPGAPKTGLAAARARGLAPIDSPPFVGMSMNRSTIGTKGGARTDAQAQVLREDGSVVAGLYAAGLAMANPIGTRALGAGTTLGPNLTWGYIAGDSLLRRNRGG